MLLNIPPEALARLRLRFAAVAEVVGPAFREVREVGDRVMGEEVAKLGPVLDAARAEQAEAFRRLGERMGEAMRAATAELDVRAILGDDLAAIDCPTADPE